MLKLLKKSLDKTPKYIENLFFMSFQMLQSPFLTESLLETFTVGFLSIQSLV